MLIYKSCYLFLYLCLILLNLCGLLGISQFVRSVHFQRRCHLHPDILLKSVLFCLVRNIIE